LAALAQLVEHIIRNDGVGCSNHPSGTTFFNCVRRNPFWLGFAKLTKAIETLRGEKKGYRF
jgi:hypothetical protein